MVTWRRGDEANCAMGISCGSSVPYLLREYGISHVFGIPGVHTLELYRQIEKSGLQHIGVRHEQGAGFMADGYARASGAPGVCLLISGPGVTNVSTALAQAYSDSIPMLVITSMLARGDLGMGRGALHEISDQRAVTAPLTGLSVIAYEPSQVPAHLARAFARFAAERPRPFHISIPLDVLELPAAAVRAVRKLPTRPAPDAEALRAAAALLAKAERPVLLLGGGAVHAGAPARLLAERTGAAVVTTIAAKGTVPESHPLSLGATLQRRPTLELVENADVVVAVATELAEPDLYVTADSEVGGSEAGSGRLRLRGSLIRVDIEAEATIRDYAVAVPILGDAAVALQDLAENVPEAARRMELRRDEVNGIRARLRDSLTGLETQHMRVLHVLRAALPPDGLVYADMCQAAYTGCVFFPTDVPRTWHFPTGYGTLGYGLPAAIGGAIACPGRAVAALVGDGGLMFTLEELATAVEHRLPIPILLWNNEGFGEIADFMQARQIPQIGVRPHNPDFGMLAHAFGCHSVRPASLAQLHDAISSALHADGPTLIEVRQDTELG